MSTRFIKLTATAGATALLAGFGAVAATSASAATPAATSVGTPVSTSVSTHTAAANTPVATAAPIPTWWGWWWCEGWPYPVTVSIPGLVCIHL